MGNKQPKPPFEFENLHWYDMKEDRPMFIPLHFPQRKLVRRGVLHGPRTKVKGKMYTASRAVAGINYHDDESFRIQHWDKKRKNIAWDHLDILGAIAVLYHIVALERGETLPV